MNIEGNKEQGDSSGVEGESHMGGWKIGTEI